MGADIYAKWRPFGSETRRLRVLAGLTQRQLSAKINVSQAMLGGIERAQRAPRREHADDLDMALNTEGILTRLWHDIAGKRDVPDWFKSVLILERNACEIRTFEPLVVPGLLQTGDYAHTLFLELRPKAPENSVNQVVDQRTQRLPELRKGRDPLMLFVIREAVFTQVVGSEMITVKQLEHIISLVEERAVQVQILPDHAAVGLCLPFRLIKLGDTRRTVAYGEHIDAGQVFDDAITVDKLSNLFGQLQAQALPPTDSMRRLKEILGEHHGRMAQE